MGIPHEHFGEKLEEMKAEKEVANDTDLTANDLKELVLQYKEVYANAKGQPFPTGNFTFTSKPNFSPSNYHISQHYSFLFN